MNSAALDLGLYGRSIIPSYRELLAALLESGRVATTHREQWRHPKPSALMIRHDVDHCMYRALMMARIEKQMGLRASYFFLHPGDYAPQNYYGAIEDGRIVHSDIFVRVFSEIADMGHEIGIHNDFVQLSDITQRPVEELIAEEMVFFARHNIAIAGTASHGSRYARAKAMTNYEIFAEVPFSGGKERGREISTSRGPFPLHSVSMKSLGLEYEAYMLKRDIYLSDIGSKFSFLAGDYQHTYAQGEIFDYTAFQQKLTSITGNAITLIHPEWWKSCAAK